MTIDSQRVKKLRTARNWSQEKLAEVSGLSMRTIQRLENGGNASIETLQALAEALEVDPNRLMRSETEAPRTPLDAVKTGLRRFSNFSGTAARFEFWWFLMFVVGATAVSSILHERAYQIAAVILLLPFLAAATRRLNDAGHSPWWQLLWLVPFGQVVVIYLLALPSSGKINPPTK